MKVKIIAPSSDEVSPSVRSEAELMPNIALTYLAALAPEGVDFKLVDMALRDPVDYTEPCDLIGITVRTPAADAAFSVADDFIKKPFSQRLLVERVKAVLRRAQPREANQAVDVENVPGVGEVAVPAAAFEFFLPRRAAAASGCAAPRSRIPAWRAI